MDESKINLQQRRHQIFFEPGTVNNDNARIAHVGNTIRIVPRATPERVVLAAGSGSFFEVIQNVIRRSIFSWTRGTEIETQRSLNARCIDTTKFNELIDSPNG
jgi:hypothetical protein